MKRLSIREATQLWKLIGKYLPEDDEYDDLLSFASIIIDEIIADDKHEVYIEALMLLSDKTLEELGEMETEEVVTTFLNGMNENDILALRDFYTKVGFAYD